MNGWMDGREGRREGKKGKKLQNEIHPYRQDKITMNISVYLLSAFFKAQIIFCTDESIRHTYVVTYFFPKHSSMNTIIVSIHLILTYVLMAA